MGANTTVKLFSQVTVVTQYLNIGWIAVLFQPQIHMVAFPLYSILSSMFRTIIIDMVYAKKSLIGKPATSTLATIVGNHNVSEFDSPSSLYRPPSFWVRLEPLWCVIRGISYKSLSIPLVKCFTGFFLLRLCDNFLFGS